MMDKLLQKIKDLEKDLKEFYTSIGGEDIEVDLVGDKIVITTTRGSKMVVDIGDSVSSIDMKVHKEDKEFFDILVVTVIHAIVGAVAKLRREEYLKNKLN